MATFSDILIGPETSDSVYVEILDVDPKNKMILIPAPARRIVSYLNQREKADVILELDEDGRVIGHSFTEGETIYREFLDNHREAAASGDLQALHFLAAIGGRFLKSRVNKYGYLPLHSRVLHHLSNDGRLPTQVFLLTLLGKFELWSPAYRNHVHETTAPILREMSRAFYKPEK